jgi:hypothetical protein
MSHNKHKSGPSYLELLQYGPEQFWRHTLSQAIDAAASDICTSHERYLELHELAITNSQDSPSAVLAAELYRSNNKLAGHRTGMPTEISTAAGTLLFAMAFPEAEPLQLPDTASVTDIHSPRKRHKKLHDKRSTKQAQLDTA